MPNGSCIHCGAFDIDDLHQCKQASFVAPLVMGAKDRAYWLADKIPAHGDYAKEAAQVLRKQADEVERLETAIRTAIRKMQMNTGYSRYDIMAELNVALMLGHNSESTTR